MVMVDRACAAAPVGLHYFVEKFICMLAADCSAVPNEPPHVTNNLLLDGTNFICRQCATVCDGCANNDVRDCAACVPGSNRVLNTNPLTPTSPPRCVCDIGYVEVDGGEVCKKCSDLIPGCEKCSSATFCYNCTSPTFNDTANANATHQKCRCATGLYLVTGQCLSYPGCLVSNYYATG